MKKSKLENIFNAQYSVKASAERCWESISGKGSSLHNTRAIRAKLPALLQQFNIKSILDIPCGDRNWMRHLGYNFKLYIGGDISDDSLNAAKIDLPAFHFVTRCNFCTDALPSVDLIFCRDALVHLSNTFVHTAINNFKRSGSTFLLTTTFPGPRTNVNRDIAPGAWRPINLQAEPFGFSEPLAVINEEYLGRDYEDKSLGLWTLQQLADYPPSGGA
jgi:hypothetical protein